MKNRQEEKQGLAPLNLFAKQEKGQRGPNNFFLATLVKATRQNLLPGELLDQELLYSLVTMAQAWAKQHHRHLVQEADWQEPLKNLLINLSLGLSLATEHQEDKALNLFGEYAQSLASQQPAIWTFDQEEYDMANKDAAGSHQVDPTAGWHEIENDRQKLTDEFLTNLFRTGYRWRTEFERKIVTTIQEYTFKWPVNGGFETISLLPGTETHYTNNDSRERKTDFYYKSVLHPKRRQVISCLAEVEQAESLLRRAVQYAWLFKYAFTVPEACHRLPGEIREKIQNNSLLRVIAVTTQMAKACLKKNGDYIDKKETSQLFLKDNSPLASGFFPLEAYLTVRREAIDRFYQLAGQNGLAKEDELGFISALESIILNSCEILEARYREFKKEDRLDSQHFDETLLHNCPPSFLDKRKNANIEEAHLLQHDELIPLLKKIDFSKIASENFKLFMREYGGDFDGLSAGELKVLTAKLVEAVKNKKLRAILLERKHFERLPLPIIWELVNARRWQHDELIGILEKIHQFHDCCHSKSRQIIKHIVKKTIKAENITTVLRFVPPEISHQVAGFIKPLHIADKIGYYLESDLDIEILRDAISWLGPKAKQQTLFRLLAIIRHKIRQRGDPVSEWSDALVDLNKKFLTPDYIDLEIIWSSLPEHSKKEVLQKIKTTKEPKITT